MVGKVLHLGWKKKDVALAEGRRLLYRHLGQQAVRASQ
jgi:hypothetical protein